MSTNISTDVLETWKAYRFVTTGWLSAQEAVTYVDLYVCIPKSILSLPMSPVADMCDQLFPEHGPALTNIGRLLFSA